MTITNRTFGVEIEFCTGKSSMAIARALTAAGIECVAEGYNHTTRSHWKIVTDGSVSRGYELVSPILTGEAGIAEVKRAAAALVAAECSVDTSTGLHVHVGANDLSRDSIVNLVRRYANNETQIDAIVPSHRRSNTYARSNVGDVQTIENHIRNYPRATVSDVCYSISDRYKKLNLQSFVKYGTVEFRQHSGTLDGSKIANWITFCLQFVEDSIIVPAPVQAPAPVAIPVAPTPAPNTLGALISERTNAIGRKFRAMAEVFAEVGPFTVISAGTLAARMEISEASVPSYISMFRDRFPGISISARRGRGYYCNNSADTIRSIMGSGTVPATPAPAPVVRPAAPAIPAPPVDRGPFANLPVEVRAYFAERAFDLR
jgi:hypothetical protein